MTPKTEQRRSTDASTGLFKLSMPEQEVHRRPIRTYYYSSVNDSVGDYSRRSRASTLHNAIRAAIMHVLTKAAAKAEFYSEDGVRIGWVRRTTRAKIEVFHTDFRLH